MHEQESPVGIADESLGAAAENQLAHSQMPADVALCRAKRKVIAPAFRSHLNLGEFDRVNEQQVIVELLADGGIVDGVKKAERDVRSGICPLTLQGRIRTGAEPLARQHQCGRDRNLDKNIECGKSAAILIKFYQRIIPNNEKIGYPGRQGIGKILVAPRARG